MSETKEQARERLLKVAKDNGVDVHHKSGVEKLTEALTEAGVAFEPYNDDTTAKLDPEDEAYEPEAEILGLNPDADEEVLDEKDAVADMRDDLTALEASDASEEEIEAEREKVAAATAALDNKMARKKASAVRKGERVHCKALSKFHVQKTDLGQPDSSGASVKIKAGQELMLPAGIAIGLEERGQIVIIGGAPDA